MKFTKKQKVLDHLKKHGSITSWEAIQNYKATRLSGIIYELRYTQGLLITSERVTGRDGTNFVRYHLVNHQMELDYASID